MNISLESCTAVSNAITGKGPRVDYTTFKAHVPQHVSREGKVLFKPSDKNNLVDLVTVSLALRNLLTDADRLDPQIIKAYIDKGYVTKEGYINLKDMSVGDINFVAEDEEELGEADCSTQQEMSKQLAPFGNRIIWLQGMNAENNFVHACHRYCSAPCSADFIIPSRTNPNYEPASWSLAEVRETFQVD